MSLDRRALLALAGVLAAHPALARGAAGWVRLRRGQGGRLFLPAVIAGRPVEALLDSAAEMTLVDSRLAAELRLTGGRAETARGSGAATQAAEEIEGVALAAAGVDLGKVSVAAVDLSDVGRRLIGGPLPLVLGRELFDAARLEIDIGGGRLRVADRRPTPRGLRLHLTAAHGIETFAIRIGDAVAQAEFDLGNGSRMLVSSAFAAKHGLAATGEVVGGGIGGAKTMKTLQLPMVTIAGRTLRNVAAAIDDNANAADANVGVAELAGFRITVDYRDQALWLA